jgi:hypothetical protein
VQFGILIDNLLNQIASDSDNAKKKAFYDLRIQLENPDFAKIFSEDDGKKIRQIQVLTSSPIMLVV